MSLPNYRQLLNAAAPFAGMVPYGPQALSILSQPSVAAIMPQIGGFVGQTLQRVLAKASNSSTRDVRDQRRAAKPPQAHRSNTAHKIRANRLSAAVATVGSDPVSAVATVAEEGAHLSSQVNKLVFDLTDYGILPAGGIVDSLKNGAVFVNGNRFDANTLVVMLAAVKAAGLYAKRASQGVLESIFPATAPLKIMTGARMVSREAEQSKREDDMFALHSGTTMDGTNSMTRVDASDVQSWPLGALVFTGATPHIGFNKGALIKMFGAGALASRNAWYAKVASLGTEALGSVLGMITGVDFAKG